MLTQTVECSAALQSNMGKVITEHLIMFMPEIVSQLMTHSDVPVGKSDPLW